MRFIVSALSLVGCWACLLLNGQTDAQTKGAEKDKRFELRQAKVEAHRIKGGPFPAVRHVGEHEHARRPAVVPTSKTLRRLKKPSPNTKTLDARKPSADDRPDPVVFYQYTPSGREGPKSVTQNAADISGADSERGVVLLSGNWFCHYSVDAGNTFKRADPTTIFPASLAGGFCCDQIVDYIPSIDRFVWFMQHNKDAKGGAFRLSIASPADIGKDFSKAWHTYWDFRASDFGQGTNDMDYPDLSFSDRFLFLSTDVMGMNGGRLVVRIPLKDLQAEGTIGVQYTDPATDPTAWGAHLVQGSSDGALWLGHKDNSTLQLFSLPDAGTTYSGTEIAVATWPNGKISSIGPNGNDWLQKEDNFPRFAVTGATRDGSGIWAAWTASKGDDGHGGFKFPNAHVRVARIDLGTHTTTNEIQIWNPDYAFAYPALSRNSRGEIGIILGWGGKKNDADAAMGILGDYVVWYRDGSNITTSRWGDFVTVRPAQRQRGKFAGFGYYTLADKADVTKCYYNPYYVLFGRKSLGP
jgi:hypothetical protein